jgi:hypothetical protein
MSLLAYVRIAPRALAYPFVCSSTHCAVMHQLPALIGVGTLLHSVEGTLCCMSAPTCEMAM